MPDMNPDPIDALISRAGARLAADAARHIRTQARIDAARAAMPNHPMFRGGTR